MHHGDTRREGKEIKNLFLKIMTESSPNLVREIDTQVQEAHRVSNKMHPKRPTPRHIRIKMPKVKDRILKAARKRQLTTRELP